MGTCIRMYVSVVCLVPGGRGYACGCVHAYVCECGVYVHWIQAYPPVMTYSGGVYSIN